MNIKNILQTIVVAGVISVVAMLAIGSGKQGIQGQKGDKGEQGIQGVRGEKGQQGEKGEKGERGLQGPKGESGAIGMPAKFGAISGPDIHSYLNVHGPLTWGSGYLATTTSGSATTLSYNDLQNISYIDLMSNTGAFTYTMPATSTMLSLLPDIGSTRKWLFHNATSSAITLTVAAGAGMDLVSLTANDDVIDAGEWAELTCTQIFYRSADNENIMCIVSELANSD